jgi:hypothetical protein
MKRFDPHALVAAIKADEIPDGWQSTMQIVRILGYTTRAGVSLPLERILKAGFAERRSVRSNRFIYRLSPKFKTWAQAKAAAEALDTFKAPAGWITLTQYARKHRRTVRGIQYRIDGSGISRRVFRNPRPVPYYRKSDLDRILSKAP